MRLLLDASPLFRRLEYRTGLARVTMELFSALSGQPGLDVHTCAWGSLEASRELRELAVTMPELRMIATQPTVAERWFEQWALTDRKLSAVAARIAHRLGQVLNVVRNPLRGAAITQFDVVHSTYARFPRVIRRSHLPTVITVHDLTPLRLPEAMVGRAQRAITRRIIESVRAVDHVACVSEATRKDFLEHTAHPAEMTSVIYNGVNHNVFRPQTDHEILRQIRAKFGLGDGSFVLTTSSLAPHKNLRLLVDAWRSIQPPSDGTLVIAGGRTASQAMVRDMLGIPESDRSIVVTGYVTDEEFRSLASACNAFLFPSLYEGFGLPVLEAMAAGAPVIAADCTSLPEVVGTTGTLLPPNDRDAWREAIASAAAAPPSTQPHEPSLKRARQFSWDRAAGEYVSLYRRLVAADGGRG